MPVAVTVTPPHKTAATRITTAEWAVKLYFYGAISRGNYDAPSSDKYTRYLCSTSRASGYGSSTRPSSLLEKRKKLCRATHTQQISSIIFIMFNVKCRQIEWETEPLPIGLEQLGLSRLGLRPVARKGTYI